MHLLTAELLRLAHHVAAAPPLAAQLSEALRSALAIVDPHAAALATAVDRLGEHLACAREHAEYIAEITARPPQG